MPIAGTGVAVYGGSFSQIADPSRYGSVVGNIFEAGELARLPGLTLVYFAASDVNTAWNTGVPYSEARAHGWLLKGASGHLLVNRSDRYDFVGDVGDPAYQKAWIANVLAFLHAHPGIKGVFVDDVLDDLAALAGQEAAKYPTQQDSAQAELSFVKAVAPALRSHGYYVLVNASGYIPGSPDNPSLDEIAWWRELGPYVNGLMDEYYQQVSDGSDALRSTGVAWNQEWSGWQRLIHVAQSMGDDFYGLTYGYPGDSAAMTYGKASFLLDWDGRGGAFIYATTNGSDPANAAWMTSIGLPLHHKREVGVGWMRQYVDGVALVDPDPSTPQTFQLPGAYRTLNGTTVTSVTLEPMTGTILSSARPLTTQAAEPAS